MARVVLVRNGQAPLVRHRSSTIGRGGQGYCALHEIAHCCCQGSSGPVTPFAAIPQASRRPSSRRQNNQPISVLSQVPALAAVARSFYLAFFDTNADADADAGAPASSSARSFENKEHSSFLRTSGQQQSPVLLLSVSIDQVGGIQWALVLGANSNDHRPMKLRRCFCA